MAPRYDYECINNHIFEVEQSIHDPVIEKCIFCPLPVKKLISPPAIIFKGGGWYKDGYSSSSSPADKKSGGGKKKDK